MPFKKKSPKMKINKLKEKKVSKIMNPKTGRYVKIGGKLGQQILKQKAGNNKKCTCYDDSNYEYKIIVLGGRNTWDPEASVDEKLINKHAKNGWKIFSVDSSAPLASPSAPFPRAIWVTITLYRKIR